MPIDETARIALKRIIPREEQSHISANENFNKLDGLVACGIKDMDLTAPPGGEADGDIYIPAATATGAWVGQEGNIAIYDGGGWIFATPANGQLAKVEDDEDELVAYSEAEAEWHPVNERWSTTEHWTGKYNGTPGPTTKVYSKTVAVTLPNATTGSTAHGITNLDVTKRMRYLGWADNATDNINIPTATSAGHVGVHVDVTNIKIYAAFNASSFAGEVRLEYQKTA